MEQGEAADEDGGRDQRHVGGVKRSLGWVMWCRDIGDVVCWMWSILHGKIGVEMIEMRMEVSTAYVSSLRLMKSICVLGDN